MKRVLIWVIPLVAVVGLVGWRYSTKKAAAAEAESQAGGRRNAAASVDLAVAGPADIAKVETAVGTIESPFKVDLSPKSSGRIDFLQVREGDAVQSGQILIRLNPSDLEGQLLQQQAAVAEARAKYAEAQISKSSNDVSIQGSIEQQKANVQTAQAEFEQAQQTYAAQIASAQGEVTDAQARVGSAESGVKTAKARLGSAQADAANAKLRADRAEKLLAEGFVAGQIVDDARAAREVALKQVDVAQAGVSAAESDLASAKAQLGSAKQQFEIAKKRAGVDVKTAQARLSQAQSALNIARANQSGSRAYSENLAALAAAVQSAEAQLAQAKAKKQETQIASSIDGVVTARNADPGSIASPGQPILTVQFLKWLYLKASLPIEAAGSVRVGQSVKVTIDSFPGRTWTGRIALVNPSADPQTRQFNFQVRLENPSGELKPGMYATVSVPTTSASVAIAIPKDAVQDRGGKTVVGVPDSKGEVQYKEVRMGRSNEELVEILSGLKAGDKVVALSYAPIKEGGKIRMPGSSSNSAKGSRP
jgi:RND family efflux transporter MFP subunit